MEKFMTKEFAPGLALDTGEFIPASDLNAQTAAPTAQVVAERVVPRMTAQEVNDLPAKAREYIHQLEANADPSGMVRENMQLRDTNKGLQKMYRRSFADGIEAAAKLADAHAGRPCAGEVLASAIRYAIDQDAAPETPEPK